MEYERILRQRNALLKSAGGSLRRGYSSSEGQAALATLDTWDSQLAHVGAIITAARIGLVRDLGPRVVEAYATLAPSSRPATVEYRTKLPVDDLPDDPEIIEALLLTELGANRNREIDRGMSLVGPHRDDLQLNLGKDAAKGFASHGETWSFALSLRLASYLMLREEGPDPILVLDDVFAELDRHRREALVGIAKQAEQVLITSAVGEELPEGLADVPAVSTHVVTVRDTDDGRISLLDADGDADR